MYCVKGSSNFRTKRASISPGVNHIWQKWKRTAKRCTFFLHIPLWSFGVNCKCLLSLAVNKPSSLFTLIENEREMTSLIHIYMSCCSMGCSHRQANIKQNISLSSHISPVVNEPFQLWIHFLNFRVNLFDDVQIAQIVIPSIVCQTF